MRQQTRRRLSLLWFAKAKYEAVRLAAHAFREDINAMIIVVITQHVAAGIEFKLLDTAHVISFYV